VAHFASDRPHLAGALALVVPALVAPSLTASRASAQEDVRTLPIRPLAPTELAAVEPLLDRALVTHIESTEFVELPQVTVIARAEVGCDAVLAVARDVPAYASFMPALDTVEAGAESEGASSYDWTWQASVLSFRGRAATSVVAEGDGASGFRVVFEMLEGDLGRARRVLRGTPVPGDRPRCQLVLAGRQDARNSNYLTRESAGSSLTLSRSLSLVLSIATVARIRGEAERRAGAARPRIAEPLGDPRSLDVDPAALGLLIARGETFVIETTDGSDLGTIVGLARFLFPAERVRAAFFDPVHFTVGLLHGATITELAREERLARYGWNVDVPFIGSSGELTIRDVAEDEVELEAISGAMRGGRMVLTTRPADGPNTYAALGARLDPSDGVPIVAAIESTDPAFRPGLVASGMLMAFRGLRRGMNEGH
jgi:hypothetical protein